MFNVLVWAGGWAMVPHILLTPPALLPLSRPAQVWKKKQAAEQKAADAAKAEKEKADAAAADSSSSGDDEKDEGNDEL